jgi:Transcriptional regulator
MELRHLKHFKVVAEELHFGRAAERLHIDPSSVSKSIKELEEKLDSKLLLRDSRKVSLTKEGHLFLEETNTIFSILKRAKHKVCSANSRAKYFKIAISSTINIHFYKLSELLRFFRQEKPEVDIQVYEVDHENLLKGLEMGCYDFGFSCSPDINNGTMIKTEKVADDKLVMLLPARHPLVALEKVSIHDITHYTLISFDSNSLFHKQLLSVLNEAHALPSKIEHVSSFGIFLSFVAAGIGILV